MGSEIGRTTSWVRSDSLGAAARFSATFRPVMVRQSPCISPASRSSLMTTGRPPMASRSAMWYCVCVCVCVCGCVCVCVWWGVCMCLLYSRRTYSERTHEFSTHSDMCGACLMHVTTCDLY